MPLLATLSYEKRVKEAAQAYDSGQFSSIAAAARKFDVAQTTLSDRLAGITPRTARTPTNKALNPIQEDALLYWIKFVDNAGFSPTKTMVVSYTNEIRRHDQPGIPHLSVKWGVCWLTAQQEKGLTIKKMKSIEAK
jgi:hypothetical protein